MSLADARAQIATRNDWFHTIDFGNGLRSPGRKTWDYEQDELRYLALPERLDGKRVLGHVGAERDERGTQHFCIDRFLGIEVEVQRGRRVTRACRNRPEARAFKAFGREYLPRSVEDQVAPVPADRLSPSRPSLFHPPIRS